MILFLKGVTMYFIYEPNITIIATPHLHSKHFHGCVYRLRFAAFFSEFSIPGASIFFVTNNIVMHYVSMGY